MSHYDRVYGDVYIPTSRHMTKYKKLKSFHMGHVVGDDRTSLMVCVCVDKAKNYHYTIIFRKLD
jgi:hypothetical protein